jgi:hypothetical protein
VLAEFASAFRDMTGKIQGQGSCRSETMKVKIRLSSREEAKALPILRRHSPGMVLPNGTYVISEGAANALNNAGVKFTESR